TRWWWFRIKATIARAAFGPKDTGLTFETKNRAVNIWLAGEHTGVVDQGARGKIVCAVDDHIIVNEEAQGVLAGHPRLMRFNLNMRIDVLEAIARRSDFGPADILRPVDDLALKVRSIDDVEINQSQPADARGGKIHSQRRS